MKEIDKVIIYLENDLAKQKNVINELSEQLNEFNLFDVKSKLHDDFIREKNGLFFLIPGFSYLLLFSLSI